MKELDFLKKKGYTLWNSEGKNIGNFRLEGHKLQKRVDILPEYTGVPLCKLNDKLSINISLDSLNSKVGWSIGICAEGNSNEWCDIKIYALDIDKLVQLEHYEKRVISMWKSFNYIK